MNKLTHFLFVVILAVIVCSCRQSDDRCVIAPDVSVDFKFTSLEDSIPAIRTKQQLVDFFSHHIALRDIFFGRSNYPNDSTFVNRLFKRFTHPAFDTVLMESHRIFGDGQSLKEEFRIAFANMKYYYPDFKAPRVETVITGLESDLFVSDTLIIVGLDWYLGKTAKYRPNMHGYMLRRYEKNYIVPQALMLFGVDSKYNKVNLQDRTVLADMIGFGKAYYFAKHMLPCAPDSIFIGYTGKEVEGARANQDMIWKRLIDDEALFATSQQMKQRFINERPKTYEVGNECPGRIGQWVGWQIVNEYARLNSVSLPELMKTSDSPKIFKGSKYNVKISG